MSAFPGDTLEINNGDLFINKEKQQVQNVKQSYRLKIDHKLPPMFWERFGIEEFDAYYTPEDSSYITFLNQKEVLEISATKIFKTVNKIVRTIDTTTETSNYIFPHSPFIIGPKITLAQFVFPKKAEK